MTDANREQLLVWLVRGAVAWYEAGLGEQPELLKSALQRYVEENDTLQSFIEDRCEVQPSAPSAKTKTNASEFRREYIQASSGKVTQKILQEMMKRRGFDFKAVKVEGQCVRMFLGLRWTSA